MILPVALISTCFLISACLGSKETCHPLEDECETIIVQRYFENCHKKDDLLLKCRTDFSELQKRHSDLQSKDAQNSKFQQGFLDLMKDHLEVLSKLRDSEVKYEQMINQKNGEIDLLRNQINDQKKTSDFANLTNQFREDIAKLEKIVNIGGSDENNLTKAEVKTGKLQTTPLLNINNQTTSKTETIDFPEICPRSQVNFYFFREIQLPGSDPFKMVCMSDLELGSRWLNVYRKYDDSKTFNRTYEDYQRGFGDAETGEFFIGLNRLHYLASGKPHEVVLYAGWGTRRCDHFVVGDRSEGYKLNIIGNCTGEDVWILPRQGTKFSSFDQDEDGVPGRNLAKEVGYGWWFDPDMSPKKDSIRMFIRRTD
ncbi:fibrinogen alpha chain-like [Drosophila bipectinata]|uniref:fibrinogen alpha chain-like n=1 Tax=Drosophila bipectinata TaxID=42026 RepID=UPI001C8AF792|nr:fibrinogen alpha chain-like [Drosophila bipectinata]